MKTNRIKYGLLTPNQFLTCIFCSGGQEEGRNCIKRAVLMFENIIVIPYLFANDLGNFKFFDSIETVVDIVCEFDKSTKKETKRELSKIFKMVEEVTDFNYQTLKEIALTPIAKNISKESQTKFINVVNNYFLTNALLEGHENEYDKDMIFGSMVTDYNLYTRISNQKPDFSGLMNELNESFIDMLLDEPYPNEKKVIKKISELNMFDFGQLSWDEIIELRKSQFLNSFRENLFYWLIEFNESESEIAFEQKLEKFIFDAKFDFIDKNLPNPKRTTISGILENIPLPIPNPLSIYNTIDKIDSENYSKNKFGWLFFIQKSYKKLKEKVKNDD